MCGKQPMIQPLKQKISSNSVSVIFFFRDDRRGVHAGYIAYKSFLIKHHYRWVDNILKTEEVKETHTLLQYLSFD